MLGRILTSSDGGTAGHRVELRRLLAAPAAHVWQLLVDPEERGQWLMPGRLEPWAGGVVDLADDHHHVTGRVTACEPPHVLALTWHSEDAPSGEVRFELSPDQDGGCRLLVTHTVGPDARPRSLAAGWHALLDALVADRLGERVDDRRGFAALRAAYDVVPVEAPDPPPA